MKYSIFDIANWFLHKEIMDHKKLQKLCYYAQAWSCVIFNKKPLISDAFEAWVHGPVNRTLWDRFKEYGYMDIPQDILEDTSKSINDKNTIQLLNSIWDTYGKFNGYQLECLTHREKPWIKARNNLSDFEPSSNQISTDVMRQYYHSLISENGVGE